MRVLIATHVPHYLHDGRKTAYGPYAREIDLVWAELFAEVRILAPVSYAEPPGDAAAFLHTNISLVPMPEFSGGGLAGRLRDLLRLPVTVWRLVRECRRADVLHVRCPGNLGFLGAFLGPCLCRRRIAKYAGQWNGYPGEAWSYRLQRALLRSRWWNAPVLVYGKWPNQPAHIIPFFTSVMTNADVEQARIAANRRTFDKPELTVLFAGRLSKAKNVDVLIRALATVNSGTSPRRYRLLIAGDGPERPSLQQRVEESGQAARVEFRGAVPLQKMHEIYSEADVLVLASETEGWPKAVAEGMAFGLVCVASNRSVVPMMLAESRGFLVEPGEVGALASVLADIANSPAARLAAISRAAAAWSQGRTIAEFRAAVANIIQPMLDTLSSVEKQAP